MSRHFEALQKALEILKKEKYSSYIKKIYLYGSCARGEQKYSSDVDLFVVVSKNTPKDVIINMRLEISNDDINLPDVELKISTSGKLESKQFNDNLQKDGVLLWEKV